MQCLYNGKVLVKDFIPDMVLEYKRLNYIASSQYKRYKSDIQSFLHHRLKHVVVFTKKHNKLLVHPIQLKIM